MPDKFKVLDLKCEFNNFSMNNLESDKHEHNSEYIGKPHYNAIFGVHRIRQ